jgi:hypothetical protein
MALRLELWVNAARIFLGPLKGKFYGKYLAWYLKVDVGGGAKTRKYVSCMMNMML